jgi:DNA polymerase-3 subunit epsilon
MRSRLRFALALAGSLGLFVALVALAVWAWWVDLDLAERERLAALAVPRTGLGLILIVGAAGVIGAVLQVAFNAYPRAARRMAEEVGVIQSANPGHRLALRGGAEMRALAVAVNALAGDRRALSDQVDARVAEANARLAQERNRLAALMSDLSLGVLVCAADGRILLYNAPASQLLSPVGEGGSPVGLGRSVFAMLDRGAIVHALDTLRQRVARQARPVVRFVTARRRATDEGDGLLLRAQMVAVPEGDEPVAGFVLTFEDITRAVEEGSRRDERLRQLTEGARASVAAIRAAAEMLLQFPQMDPSQRLRFTEVLLDEARQLSARIDDNLAAGLDDAPASPWPREDMRASDLVFALQRAVETVPGTTLRTAIDPGTAQWLCLDSHAVVPALAQLVNRLIASVATDTLTLELAPAGRFARLALAWEGEPLDPAQLHSWEAQPLPLASAADGATLKDVLARHGGELWVQPAPATAPGTCGRQRLCIQLPSARTQTPAVGDEAAASRPVYYDFDLFAQPGQHPDLDAQPLAALAFTVFDTETTGLSPSEGDEIVSIGAVRIVNGRLLEQECFDRLIQPRRAVRPEAQKIHGITPAMLAGQPMVEQVLPQFARFAEDTVLVAHNAAFDLRFLQMAEARTGLRFDQPVLDTLLLSALVHPGHEDDEHRLERIAARLGVGIVGRHTALGDAIVTGEIFLRLVPLLAERGITSLGQAREASRRTVYAKLEY